MTAPDVAARVTAWLDRLEAELPPATPEPFWQRCGCLSLVGEIPSVDYCHQAGLCSMRLAERRRDDAARALLALARGVTALAEELDRRAATNDGHAADGWQRNAERRLGEADAQYAAAKSLRRLLADAAPDTGEETA